MEIDMFVFWILQGTLIKLMGASLNGGSAAISETHAKQFEGKPKHNEKE